MELSKLSTVRKIIVSLWVLGILYSVHNAYTSIGYGFGLNGIIETLIVNILIFTVPSVIFFKMWK